MDILRGSLPSDQDADVDIKPLCVSLAGLYETGEVMRLAPTSHGIQPRGLAYRDIDLDDEGVTDKIEVGCGAAECLLDVKLSTGDGLDFNESPFSLIRCQSGIHAIVGLPSPPPFIDSP